MGYPHKYVLNVQLMDNSIIFYGKVVVLGV